MTLPLLGTLKLRGRLTLYVTLLAIAPLIVLNWMGITTTRELMQRQVRDMLHIEAEGLKDLVEAALAEHETSVRGWAEDLHLRDALVADSYERSNEVLERLQLRHTNFTGLVLFNDEGRAVSASTPALLESFLGHEEVVRNAPWFLKAQEGRFTSETLLEEDPVFGMQVLHLAAPVLESRGGRRLGVLLAAYDWGQIGGVMRASLDRARGRGHESFALVVRAPGGRRIFDSRGANAQEVPNAVTVEAFNEKGDIQDVGDGWLFVAMADPEEVYREVDQVGRVVVGLTVLVVALAALAAFLLARTIAHPITRLNEAMRYIIREGDLSQKLTVDSRDEVGELATSFMQLVGNLRETTLSLQRGTRVLTDTVEELTRASGQQEQNVSRQASALQQTQVTAQEIKQTSLLAAEKADTVLQVATRAEKLGSTSTQALDASMTGFQALRDQTLDMVERINQLQERAKQIGGITDAVKSLADRSNMLALNAAIEAVRSGEHGKGFGVVAKEIRTLANQSIRSTEQVRGILEDISQAILATVTLSEQGQTRVEQGLVQARTSGESLQALTAIVQDSMGAVRQIAGAVSQQNAGITQIFTAVTDMSGMMNDTLEGLQATQRVTRALQEVSDQMQKVARSYRV
jgi:methyl-accepting chemotaxis protein